MKWLLLFCALLSSVFFAPCPTLAQENVPQYGLHPPKAINPALPNVLLLGDSISLGYAPIVEENLTGIANVYRILGSEAATIRRKGTLRLDTTAAIQYLDDWIAKIHWTVIHFNWGLHDIKIQPSGEHQTSLANYRTNLSQLVKRLQATHADLIWASTTPVPKGAEQGSSPRKAGDEIPFNEVAMQVMDENSIPVDDLHALVLPNIRELQRPANVHFTPDGSRILGMQVAQKIQEALQRASSRARNQDTSN